jgi:hypothetical protein
MKAHHFFAVGLSKKAHLEYDADHDGFEKRHGVTHATEKAGANAPLPAVQPRI